MWDYGCFRDLAPPAVHVRDMDRHCYCIRQYLHHLVSSVSLTWIYSLGTGPLFP